MDVAFKAGTVKEILFESEQRQDIVIVTDSGSARAINLLELTGPAKWETLLQSTQRQST